MASGDTRTAASGGSTGGWRAHSGRGARAREREARLLDRDFGVVGFVPARAARAAAPSAPGARAREAAAWRTTGAPTPELSDGAAYAGGYLAGSPHDAVGALAHLLDELVLGIDLRPPRGRTSAHTSPGGYACRRARDASCSFRDNRGAVAGATARIPRGHGSGPTSNMIAPTLNTLQGMRKGRCTSQRPSRAGDDSPTRLLRCHTRSWVAWWHGTTPGYIQATAARGRGFCARCSLEYFGHRHLC